jgi:hypothetical protein
VAVWVATKYAPAHILIPDGIVTTHSPSVNVHQDIFIIFAVGLYNSNHSVAGSVPVVSYSISDMIIFVPERFENT